MRSIALHISLLGIFAATPVHTEEIEKKFSVTNVNRVIENLNRYATHTKTKQQYDRYFDTADNYQYQRGEYTRLRKEVTPHKPATHTLCFKRILDTATGNQRRQEDEHTVHDVDTTINQLYEQGLIEKVAINKQRQQYTYRQHNEPFVITIDSITFKQETSPQTYSEIEYAGKNLPAVTALAYIDDIASKLALGTPETRSNLDIAFSYYT